MMALEVMFKHQPAMAYVTVGRSFYTPAGSRQLTGGIEVWNGYYQSVKPTLGKNTSIRHELCLFFFFFLSPPCSCLVPAIDHCN